MNKLTQAQIEVLLKENDVLKRENKYLKNLVNSKRFRFAEKIATSYNIVLPKNTKRRNFAERIGKVGRDVLYVRERRQQKTIIRKIDELAKGYNKVIVLNSVPWDLKLKQRPHHLADEFSELGFFVVYLEYDNLLKNFRQVKKNLITINSEKYIFDLPKVCEKCYFLSPNNMPTKYTVLKAMVDAGYKFIYDYLDEFHEDISGDLSIQMEVWDKLKNLKPVVCVATAKRLYDDLKTHLGTKQKVVMASNAVDVEHFNFEKHQNDAIPSDMKDIVGSKKPIVGFYGALAPWIDFDMLNDLAVRRPEWEFVYLGVDYNNAAAGLKLKENVHNLGAKNYENLPKYAKYFDCAMIPFRQGEIAKATSPVKLFEYMAAGLPTVCTRDLDECAGYDYVYMSKNDAEFEKNIKLAIADHKDITKRKVLLAQAEENTWKKRAETIVNNL